MSINAVKVLHLSMPSLCKLHMYIISRGHRRAHDVLPVCSTSIQTVCDVYVPAGLSCSQTHRSCVVHVSCASNCSVCIHSGFGQVRPGNEASKYSRHDI